MNTVKTKQPRQSLINTVLQIARFRPAIVNYSFRFDVPVAVPRFNVHASQFIFSESAPLQRSELFLSGQLKVEIVAFVNTVSIYAFISSFATLTVTVSLSTATKPPE